MTQTVVPVYVGKSNTCSFRTVCDGWYRWHHPTSATREMVTRGGPDIRR